MALENKLGITNSAELAREEERISKKKAVELFESGALDKLAPGRFASLQAIHKALFEDMKDLSVLQEAPFTDHGSIVEVFTDLTVWMGIRNTIEKINSNAVA